MIHRAMFTGGIAALGFVLTGFPPEARSDDQAPGSVSPSSVPGLQAFTHDPGLYPILPWDTLHGWNKPDRNPKHGLESISECDFTLGGFVKPEDLPLCEKLGLAAIMAPVEGDQPWFGEWRKLKDDEIDRRVNLMVEKTAQSKALLGYFLMDEPGAPSFPALAKAVAAVKKYAPGKLA